VLVAACDGDQQRPRVHSNHPRDARNSHGPLRQDRLSPPTSKHRDACVEILETRWSRADIRASIYVKHHSQPAHGHSKTHTAPDPRTKSTHSSRSTNQNSLSWSRPPGHTNQRALPPFVTFRDIHTNTQCFTRGELNRLAVAAPPSACSTLLRLPRSHGLLPRRLEPCSAR
jgi:hypothetical protein